MPRKPKDVKLTKKAQLEIFYTVFRQLIEKPSIRWRLRDMIDIRDDIDDKEVEIKLDTLYIEILKRHKEEGE